MSSNQRKPRSSARNAPPQHARLGEVSEKEVEDIETHSRLRTPVLYEIVRREGEIEMQRPATSLWWSGAAAGLSISFSLLAQAILYTHLPDAPWRPLLSSLGYSVGFLIVVLGRQQLFTENTITVVLPFIAEPNAANLRHLVRMWGIVFAANTAGTLVAALFWSFSPALTAQLHAGMLEISAQLLRNGWAGMFFKGVAAGFLMAAMVWLIPSAAGAQFQVVTLATYLIAVGGFTHIVAGSVEAFMLVLNGQLGIGRMLTGFTAPVLSGNIVGGTALFAVLSYAQVMMEM
jgi:formate/nitrite transporter FocA (FNT family)